MKVSKLEKQYFNEIYNILVIYGGASEHMRDNFVYAHLEKDWQNRRCEEYRFQGHLLFGGKYRSYTNTVDYYNEDRNEYRDSLEKDINIKLKEIYEKYCKEGLTLEDLRGY
jgi:hypothetical protein